MRLSFRKSFERDPKRRIPNRLGGRSIRCRIRAGSAPPRHLPVFSVKFGAGLANRPWLPAAVVADRSTTVRKLLSNAIRHWKLEHLRTAVRRWEAHACAGRTRCRRVPARFSVDSRTWERSVSPCRRTCDGLSTTALLARALVHPASTCAT